MFTGKRLINWILNANLEDNRLNAHAYGQALIISRIIEDVHKSHNLIDDDECLYRFVESEIETNLESDNGQSKDNPRDESPSSH